MRKQLTGLAAAMAAEAAQVAFAVAAVLGVLPVFSANVVYSEKPETEPIVVSGGTASIICQDAFANYLYAAWTFDDVNDRFRDVSGHGAVLEEGSLTAADDNVTESLTAEDDVIRGAASIGVTKTSRGLRLQEIPDFLLGDDPFTISFWVRVTDQIQVNSSGIPTGVWFYLGNSVRSHSDNAVTNCVAIQSYSMNEVYVGNLQQYKGRSKITLSADVTNRWYHVAIVYQPPTDIADPAATGVYKFYLDGKSVTAEYRLLKEAVEVCCFGLGKNGTASRALRSNVGTMETAFDELFIFQRALSDEEVAYVRDNSRPPDDFSAEWTVEGDGRLELLGTTNQIVRGYGEVDTNQGLSLTPTNDTYFAGRVTGGGLSVSTASSATQTLAGVSSYSGKTVVKGGTLLVSPITKRIPASLAANAIAYWTLDDPDDVGKDVSGYGNDLTLHHEGDLYATSKPSDIAGFGKMLDFPGETATNYYSSSGVLNGLTVTQYENCKGAKFSVSAWFKLENAASSIRSGFFAMNDCGIRLDNRTDLYFGNQGKLKLASLQSTMIDGAWHHLVMVADPEKADATDEQTNFVYQLYYDGVAVGNTWQFKDNIGNYAFVLAGGTTSTGRGRLDGQIDDVSVFNRVATADEVAALYAMGTVSTPTDATGVLPSTTVLEVRSGATAAFENANETVAGLTGAGAVDLTARSRLAVTDTMGFTGTVSGAGKLALGANLKWETPVDEKGCALAGKYTYFTVPAAMLDAYSTENWTTVAPLRRGGEFHVVAVENGDDVTFRATVTNPGLMIIFR